MKKFQGTDNVLNLIVPSKVSKASLNHHVILVLHCLGVDEKYFMDHLKKALEQVSPEKIWQLLEYQPEKLLRYYRKL